MWWDRPLEELKYLTNTALDYTPSWNSIEKYTIEMATDNWQFVCGVLAGFIIIMAITSADRIQRYWKDKKIKASRIERGRLMTRPEQENLEKVLIGDIITDGLEELEYQGKMSRERVSIWYRRFGNLLNMPDFLQRHELLLKDQIRKRLGKSGKPIPSFNNKEPSPSMRSMISYFTS